MSNNFLLNITPREYQNEILKKCIEKNCLVVLPTGIGKTLVALMLVIERMKQFPLEKVLFLAPTRPLAQQHLSYFKKHLPELFAQIDIFTGQIPAEKRKKTWERADIIFSTPQCIANDVKNKLYAKFQDLSLDFYAKKRTGELISRITNDVGCVSNALSYALTDLIFESMQIVVFGLVALPLGFAISWKLYAVFLIFPAIFIPVGKIGKRIKKFSREVQNKMADLNSLLTETIQGAYIVKVFCRENYEIKRFKEINQQYYRFTMKSVKRIIMVTHGIFLKMIISFMTYGDTLTASQYNTLSYFNPINNAGMAICSYTPHWFKEGEWKLLVWNDLA